MGNDRIVLDHSVAFTSECAADFFTQFPAAPGVFLLRGKDAAAEPYAGKTTSLRRRLQRLLSPPEAQSRRLNLRDRVATIQYTPTGSDFESTLLLYKLLRQEFPASYQKRLRLRPAPLIRLNLDNEYPRAYVTTKLGRLGGKSIYYGPFRSRVLAEKFMNDSLDLFKMRRCTFDLNPDPKFPGCVYSEMKMCLAPCFKGCTDQEYAGEVARVRAYFDSGGESLLSEMEAERDRLSAALDFEAAAQQHARIAKLKGILSAADELSRRVDRIDAVIIQPSPNPDSVNLFRFEKGRMAGPLVFALHGEDGQSMEHRILIALEQLLQTPGARSAVQLMEEMAILKRWYFRTHKAGQIILPTSEAGPSARKIANAIRRPSGTEAKLDAPPDTSDQSPIPGLS